MSEIHAVINEEDTVYFLDKELQLSVFRKIIEDINNNLYEYNNININVLCNIHPDIQKDVLSSVISKFCKEK